MDKENKIKENIKEMDFLKKQKESLEKEIIDIKLKRNYAIFRSCSYSTGLR